MLTKPGSASLPGGLPTIAIDLSITIDDVLGGVEREVGRGECDVVEEGGIRMLGRMVSQTPHGMIANRIGDVEVVVGINRLPIFADT